LVKGKGRRKSILLYKYSTSGKMATLIPGNASSYIFLNVESTFLVDAIQSFEVESFFIINTNRASITQ